MDVDNYVAEAERQLENTEFYKTNEIIDNQS